MDIATPADPRLAQLKELAGRWIVQPEYDLLMWAHDEIVKLRAALKSVTETSLDEWEFVDGVVVGKIYLIARTALEDRAPAS